MDKRKLTELLVEHKEKALGDHTFTPTCKQIALIGILSFFVFACLENIVCMTSIKMNWQYYLVSFSVWLILGLVAFSFSCIIQAAIKKIFRNSWSTTWLLVFILFLPNMIYTVLQAARRTWRFNNFSKFALLLLVFVAFTLAIRYVHGIIKNNQGKAGVDVALIVLVWGFFSIFGTLIVGAELQNEHWVLNILVLVTFHFIIPFLIAFSIRRWKLIKPHFKILTACGLLVAFVILSNIIVTPFLLEVAYGQSGALPGASPASGVKKRPNIVLIVMDTARAANMSLYGYKRQTTPRLQEFAHDAVVFQNAISSAPWTLPAHATLFTGLPSYLHFATNSDNMEYPPVPLAEHYDTLAEILHSNGYKTGAVVANTAVLSPKFGLSQGFEFFWWGKVKTASLFIDSVFRGISSYFPSISIDFINTICGLSDLNNAACINQVSLSWIKNHTLTKRPWLLFINYMETHGTTYLPSPFSDMFSVLPHQNYILRNPATGLPKRLDPRFVEEKCGWYDNEMACLDFEIGELLNRLKECKLYNDTLIVVTSDHGELLGEHEDFGHSYWLYQELLHVPLIVKYPQGKNGGQTSGKAVQNSDIFAEILEQAGIALPPDIMGQPFAMVDHLIFSEAERNPKWAKKWSVKYKYKHNLKAIYSKVFNHLKLIHSDNGKNELYDICMDSGEKNKLIDSNKTATILGELENYLGALNALREKFLKKQPSRQKKLDLETLNRLRALGYLN